MNDVVINFIVQQLTLRRVSTIRIPSGSRNYICARFMFSNNWKGMAPIAIFSRDTNVMHVPLIDNECPIPNVMMEEPGNINVSVFAGNLKR